MRDRHAARRHPQALGDQPSQGAVRATVDGRLNNPDDERAVALTDDLAPPRPRLEPHADLGCLSMCISGTHESDTGSVEANRAGTAPETAIVVHGGAGPVSSSLDENEPAYRDALIDAVRAAHETLSSGAGAVAAAEAAVVVLEDCPLFNAGRGSVLNENGAVEMDAALMCGASLDAGAVAGVTRVRNPVALARVVMERTPHVLMVGAGAERLAREQTLPLMELDWFVTDRERAAWSRRSASASPRGTVGAVVRDGDGHLAAATSTGGMRGQRMGRVGDSPVIGAGTYADDAACAVSATGAGEPLMRAVVGHEVASLVRHRGLPLADACRLALEERVGRLGGSGGLIAVDTRGNIAMPFTTEIMFRAWRLGDRPPEAAIG